MGQRITSSQAAASQIDHDIERFASDRDAMQYIFDLVRHEALGRKEAQDAAERWMRASAHMKNAGSIRRWATFREYIRLWKRK